MDSQKLFNWVQLITGLSILAGLILVVWELQQAREIARIQEAREGFASYATSVRAIMGENPAAVWAKACEDPDGMTGEEVLVMDHILHDLLNRMRATYARQKASRDLAGASWDQWTGNFRTILGTEFGRWWWGRQQWVEPEIVAKGNEYLEQERFSDCVAYIEDYKNRGKTY